MDLYNGKINEYVDWSTSRDLLTGISKSGQDMPSSGGSIRLLLQDHLKKPFVYNEDTADNKIYFFSSQEALDLWYEHRNEDNNEKYRNLLLYSMTKPSDYTIVLNDTFARPRYATSGNENQDGLKMAYTWDVKLGDRSEPDDIVVSYTITNPSGRKRNVAESKHYGERLDTTNPLNLYEYLENGTNTIDILFSANNTGAKRSVQFTITVLTFSVSSTFSYYSYVNVGDSFIVPVSLDRNITTQNANIYVNIDGQMASINGNAAGLPYTVNAGVSGIQYLTISNREDLETGLRPYRGSTGSELIQHIMLIWAETTYDSVVFRSNLLYYTFEIKSDRAITNQFINVGLSYDIDVLGSYPLGQLTIYGKLYEPITIPWGYYTDSIGTDTAVTIDWKIEQNTERGIVIEDIASLRGEKTIKPADLSFVPVMNSTDGDIHIKAFCGEELLLSIPAIISKSTNSITRPSGMDIELSAYSKSNTSDDKNMWIADGLSTNITLSNGIKYNSTSGWYDHALRISGETEYAIVDYNPFIDYDGYQYRINDTGRTIEFEFESERVDSDNDVIIRIGSDDKYRLTQVQIINESDTFASLLTIGQTFLHHELIEAFSNNQSIELLLSQLQDSDDIVLNTLIGSLCTFKKISANESRIDVTPNSATLYNNSGSMVIKTNFKNNERVKLAFILNPISNTSDNQLIYIVANGILERASQGGASFGLDSGIIRIGGSKSGIKFYNMRIYNYAISYDNAYNNYVYDSPNKNVILTRNNVIEDNTITYSKCCAKIDTILISGELDALLNGKTDKDLSTINATIKRTCPYDSTKDFTVENAQIRKHGLSTLSYPITSMKFWLNKKFQPNNKNDIPIFSCPGLANLGLAKNRYKMKDDSIPANKFILQANYADSSGVHNGGLQRLINDTWYKARVDNKYVLRTEPLLFTSISQNEKSDYGMDHVWHDYIDSNFPFDIRTAPDSFPCVVFYKNGQGEETYLGQYVFMEDKKSDFNYGERSIYKADSSDPFCMKTTNKNNDTDANKIWDNENVLRIEVLDINEIFTSYMSWTKEGVAFDADIPEQVIEVVDEETGDVTRVVIPRHYKWEESFEMIYPDPDDITGDPEKETDKFGANSKFRRTAQPFLDWVKWLTDCRNNYNNTTSWWLAGTYNSAQAAFLATAANHLDLYKLAAYYIFVLRFGLVDSLERNAQIKTYDGIHFHYEPWDMDIAMGNRNDGGIAFNPPVDRNTRLGQGYAISGRSTTTSNWLWDALETWPEWASVTVKNVAAALFEAGLTYDKCQEMFDENYAEKWSEILYNKSGYYKYIIRGGGSQMYLNWLQGARMLHRHWWLSSSMNYYDAKWGVGSFNDSRIDLYVGHNGVAGSQDFITVYPSQSTFFKMTINQDAKNLGTQSATKQNPARFNVGPETFVNKVPTYIYGANFIEKLDLSIVAEMFARAELGGSFDKILGAPIKELNIGIPITKVDDDTYTGILNTSHPGAIETSVGEGENKIYPLTNLQSLNVRGLLGEGAETGNFYTTFTMLRDLVDNRGDLSQVKYFYGMGSGIVDFMSSNQGNSFEVLELPSSIYTLDLNNSSWEDLSFWTTQADGDNATFTRYSVNGDSNLYVPTTIHEIKLNGTSAHSLNSKNLVMAWINGIIAELGENPTELQINQALSSKVLRMNDVKWDKDTCGAANLLTYEELSLIAKIGTYSLKGYIMLASGNMTLTSELLTLLTRWFGNDVFTYSSSGLIIDYNLERTIINVAGDIYVDLNQEIHIKEGHEAILNATQFHLRNDSSLSTWTIRERIFDLNDHLVDTIPGANVKSCYLHTDNPKQIVLEAVHSEYSAYSIFVHSSLGDAEIVIHIDPTDYPVLAIENTENRARLDAGKVSFYSLSIDDNFSVVTKSAVAGAASILDISWSIMIPGGTVLPMDLTNDPNTYKRIGNPAILQYKRGNTRLDVMLSSLIPNSDENIYSYKLIAEVNLGGKVETLTKDIVILNDISPIVSSDGSYMYNALNNLYTSINGTGTEAFYRSTLLSLTGTLDFSIYPNIQRLVVSGNKSILYYLLNIDGLNLDSCQQITSTYTIGGITIPLLIFDNINSFKYLSIQNCTGLTEDIDLTGCPDITQVKAIGTSINVLVPENSKLTKYELGSPTSISIVNPTVLQPSGVVVSNYGNLDSLDIINIPNNQSFNMFDKITKTIGANILLNTLIVSGQNTLDDAWNCTSEMYVPASSLITVSRTCYISLYKEDGTFIKSYLANAGSQYAANVSASQYGYMRISFSSSYPDLIVTDVTNNRILLKYEV